MSNRNGIRPGMLMVGTILSWLVISFLVMSTYGRYNSANALDLVLWLTCYFAVLISLEAFINILINWEWVRFNLGIILSLCAPALAYLAWFFSNILFS